MRRRSRAGGEPAKAHRRKTVARKTRVTSKAARGRSSSIASLEAKVARLTRERDELLEQQTATSEVLQIISSSPGDLEPVLAAMLEKAVRICDAKFGNIYRWDGDTLHVSASYNTPPAYAEERKRAQFRADQKTAISRMICTKAVVHVHDLRTQASYIERNPLTVAAVELGGIRTILAVPMLKEGELIGAFGLSRQEVCPFTDKQIELVQNFAAQAVIAIENARLLNELRQRTADLTELLEQQTATSEVLRVISNSPSELDPVFQTMLANATRLCEAHFGILHQFDGTTFHIQAAQGLTPAYADLLQRTPQTPDRRNTLGRLLETREPIHVADLTLERAYLEREPIRVAVVEMGGARTLLAVPMLKETEVVGSIVIFRKEVRPFTDKQIELVKNFASQAVIAIENTRLLNELRQRTDDLTERTADLTEALEQQTATSEVLQVTSSSPGDLEPVFVAILDKAVRICGAKFGVLFLSEGDAFRSVALHGAPPEYADTRRRVPIIRPSPDTAVGRVAATKKTVQIADIRAEPAYTNDPERFAVLKLAGARTMLTVPMLKEEELVGQIAIYRQEVRPFSEKQIELVTARPFAIDLVGAIVIYSKEARPFTDKQIELLENFASQAVIAIDNTRLLNELRESLQQQTATADVLKTISRSTFDLTKVLNTLVELAARLCDADSAGIHVPKGTPTLLLQATALA